MFCLFDEVLPPAIGHINNVTPLFEEKLAYFHRVVQGDFDPVIVVSSYIPLAIVK